MFWYIHTIMLLNYKVQYIGIWGDLEYTYQMTLKND